MKELIEKIVERIKESQKLFDKNSENNYQCGAFYAFDEAIDIIQKEATAYNDAWIPCSSGRLPEEGEIYEVTATFSNGTTYTEFAYYDYDREEWWKYDESGILNVLAWRNHLEHYQPKGE